MENKSEIVPIRFKPSELKLIDEEAKKLNLTRSDYIRQKLTERSGQPIETSKINWQMYGVLAQIYQELTAISNNIKSDYHRLLIRIGKRQKAKGNRKN
jgi:hypothetical protein